MWCLGFNTNSKEGRVTLSKYPTISSFFSQATVPILIFALSITSNLETSFSFYIFPQCKLKENLYYTLEANPINHFTLSSLNMVLKAEIYRYYAF